MDLDDARTLAEHHLDRHGLTARGWTFAYNRRKTACGICNYGDQRIELSRHHAELNDEPVVLDTILHEVAHALAGPRAKHGPKWKRIAAELGATPRATTSKDDVAVPDGRYTATCGHCGHTFHRHRRPPSVPCWCHHCGPDLGALRFRDAKTGRLTRVRRPAVEVVTPPPRPPSPTRPDPAFAKLPLFAALFGR
ncbi:MAG: SprT-like domain-containing protein, partial [Planctomycetota bacterium]